jgi:hypothetical protein
MAMTVTLAIFMEVLDTSMANVALPQIAGALSTGLDESTCEGRDAPGLFGVPANSESPRADCYNGKFRTE